MAYFRIAKRQRGATMMVLKSTGLLLIGLFASIAVTESLNNRVRDKAAGSTRWLEEVVGEIGGSEEREEERTATIVNTVIVLFLILLTIVFEIAKEHVEEKANRNMKVIVEKLFAEMTVLGFLSTVTFCITRAGFFEVLSERIYGNHEELLEVFESIHFCLFFIMVFFVLQVLVLVGEAMQQEETWLNMDRQCRTISDDWINEAMVQKKARRGWKSVLALFPGFRNAKEQHKEDMLVFKAIRDEFILDRSVEPPFTPQPVEKRVQEDFNFGRYLSVCLGRTLAHTVEVSTASWGFFAVGSILYAGLHWALDYNINILVWTWVGTGWAFFLFEVAFEWHLLEIRDKFAARLLVEDPIGDASNGTATDTTALVNESLDMPGWTLVNLRDYRQKRSWLVERLVGGTPNRQQALYWADRRGPIVYLLVLQIKLIFVGLYLSVHFLEFSPRMYHDYSVVLFLVYATLSILPILGIVFNATHFIATLSQVCCLGTYRRPQVISAVLREDKTVAAVCSLICIYKLRKFASDATNIHTHRAERAPASGALHYDEFFTEQERREVCRTFDAFDLNGNGSIALEEIQELMLSLGAPVMPSQLRTIMGRLDADSDGEISRAEFLQWYSETMVEEDHMSEHERAEFLFGLFDHNKSGEISIGEFKTKLDALNAGLTIDDVGAIVNELDEDSNGTVGVEEFHHLLHKYYPKELKRGQIQNGNGHH